jgi:hypothetical protein
MNPLTFAVFIAFAYYAGRKIAILEVDTRGYGPQALLPRIIVEGGILLGILGAALQSLTPKP